MYLLKIYFKLQYFNFMKNKMDIIKQFYTEVYFILPITQTNFENIKLFTN